MGVDHVLADTPGLLHYQIILSLINHQFKGLLTLLNIIIVIDRVGSNLVTL